MTTLIKKILLLPATCLIPLLTGCNNCPSTTIVEDIIDPAIYTSLPFKMDKVEQPTFPDYSVNIIDFGAKPDGITFKHKRLLMMQSNRLMPKAVVKSLSLKACG